MNVGQNGLGLLPIPSSQRNSTFRKREKSVGKNDQSRKGSAFNDSKLSQTFDRSRIKVLT